MMVDVIAIISGRGPQLVIGTGQGWPVNYETKIFFPLFLRFQLRPRAQNPEPSIITLRTPPVLTLSSYVVGQAAKR